jgi:hypothetical protein
MPRAVDLLTLFIFLIAIAGNCFQASQVTLDPIASPVTVHNASSPSADNSEFLLADDDSDDTPSPLLVQNTFMPVGAVLLATTFPIGVVAVVQAKQPTVLRL